MAEKDYVKTVYVDGSEPDVDAVHLNNTEDGLDGLYHPEFDDSGTVEGITSFPTFLSTVVKRMNPIAFYKNFKAGMKYVLHTGSLINNGLCTETGKYAADATQLNPNIANTLAWQVAKVNSDLTESQNGVLLYSGKIKYNDEISVPNLHKYKLFHLGDNQNELYGCDVGGVVGNVLEFNLSGQVSGRAVFSSIKFHIIKANTLKVIFNIQVNVTADNAIEYVGLERESQITLWGVPLI
ncbi:hypothetical protein [Enterocloster lavalensis]|uniref:hypothetical protein n=1 Tax=Enterocloster lavalensis TaxID=460384 RepID=UPI001FA934CE|nr:hypothetical protein [Enterocloster lavalensis]